MGEQRMNPTYDMGEAETEGEVGRDSMHEIEHVGLACLVLILQVAVVEVLLKAPGGLRHLRVFLVHHQHAIEASTVGQRVLTLHH